MMFAFVELLAFQQMLQRHRMRFRRIAAHDDLRLGIADVVEAVGHRAVAPGIGHAGHRRRMADARLVVLVVGAPERRQLAEQISAFVGELGRAQPVDRVGPRLLADLLELVADLVDGLVPLDAGPLAVDHLHRIFQAAFAHHQFAHRGALGAMRAAIDRTIPARLLADPDAVGDFRRDRAADRAMRTDALADGDRRRPWPAADRPWPFARCASGKAPSVARPPAARPDRRRKVRRSRPLLSWLARAARLPRRA